MNNVNLNRNKNTPKPLKGSIRRDGINPSDYLRIHHAMACEDCTHFKHSDATCTLGNVTKWHLRAFQEAEYQRTGKVAICRFMEID